MQVRRSDVMSAWSGIRPLATDPDAADTANASRDHVVSMDTDGMITIAGTVFLQACNVLSCQLFEIPTQDAKVVRTCNTSEKSNHRLYNSCFVSPSCHKH